MGYFNVGGFKNESSKSSRWNGKTWSVLGDSNTENNFRALKKYHGFIAERIGCEIDNHGYSGFGYLDRGNGTYVASKIPEMNIDADLITVLAGGNDVNHMKNEYLPIGELGDNDPTTSFYGAVDYTIDLLIKKYPTKTVAVISQFKRAEGQEEVIQSMVKSLKDVCGKYSVPFLDLYNEGNVHAYNETYINQCMPDGVHLNDKGSELLSWKIQSFIESL